MPCPQPRGVSTDHHSAESLRIWNAADEPPLVLVEDAVMPLAHRQGEANGFHEPVCEPGQLVARTTLDLASGDRPAVNAFAPSP